MFMECVFKKCILLLLYYLAEVCRWCAKFEYLFKKSIGGTGATRLLKSAPHMHGFRERIVVGSPFLSDRFIKSSFSEIKDSLTFLQLKPQ